MGLVVGVESQDSCIAEFYRALKRVGARFSGQRLRFFGGACEVSAGFYKGLCVLCCRASGAVGAFVRAYARGLKSSSFEASRRPAQLPSFFVVLLLFFVRGACHVFST